MPPRIPSTVRNVARINREPFVCTTCLLGLNSASRSSRSRVPSSTQVSYRSDLSSRNRPNGRITTREQRSTLRLARSASNGSLASRTAINAPSTVPEAYRKLYRSLAAFQDTASSFVDLSRLQLATRSLESSDAVIRIAFLGLGEKGVAAARRLARVLLGDALSEEQDWEKEIETASDGRSLLLRYGDPEDAVQASPLIRTLNIPSRFLQRHHLEILLGSLSAEGPAASSSADLEEAILVPPLTIPTSGGGRVGFIRFPVHKALLVADGVRGAIEYGRLAESLAGSGLINAAIDVPQRSAEREAPENSVDIDLGSHALSLFRQSTANGAQFNEEWQLSQLPRLVDWIVESKDQQSLPFLKPAVHDLISSILTRTSNSISATEAAQTAVAATATIPDPKRTTLHSAIAAWSASAHRDLQQNLDTAFDGSPAWKRTAWWRLFWRIDDVTVSAANLLRNNWLTEAEQELAFLSGRIYESGLASAEELSGPMPALVEPDTKAKILEVETKKTQPQTVAELLQVPSTLSRMQRNIGVDTLHTPPWPQSINLSRQYMLHTLVPDLHSRAQTLLVQTLGTIAGSAALSAWFFVATAGIGLYESGAIVALGLVWSLRRLQTRWSRERKAFADAVREDARRVLGEVDGLLRRLVGEGGRAKVRPEDAQAWTEARQAVGECSKALEVLQRKRGT